MSKQKAKKHIQITTPSDFAAQIEEMVANSKGQLSYYDAVTDILERDEEIEPETVATLIMRNQRLKSLIHDDAEKLNLVEKISKLPLD